MRRALFLAALLGAAACDGGPTQAPSPEGSTAETPDAAGRGDVPMSMVVTLRDGARPDDVARDHGLSPRFVYRSALNGFAGTMSTLARSGLLKDSRVLGVEIDRPFEAHETVQAQAPWGLDRVDQHDGLDGTYRYDGTGRGVTVYVVDTGIRYTHVDFGGRARFGFDAFGGDGSDCYGHGTHVAGTAAGTTYGVAKQAAVVSVRVLDCDGSGSTSTVVAGLDWIAAHAVRPAVANLSLGGGVSDAVDAAIVRVFQAGIPVVVSAGNSGFHACLYSPARVPEAMTIGASSIDDERPSWSNYGDCVDWYAPGVSILSAFNDGDQASRLGNGTSMAAPHTAGAAALYLERHPTASSAEVSLSLGKAVTTRAVNTGQSGPRASLLYTRFGSGGDVVNAAPTPAFDVACAGLTCSFSDRSTDSDGSVVAWRWDFGSSGATADVPNPTHDYPTTGSRTVTLTVTDDDGATGTLTRTITVTEPSNAAPQADFTATCADLTCTFEDGSADADGSIAAWHWVFGDGSEAHATGPATQTHTFGQPGTYEVHLTVTDDGGATDETRRTVSVGGATNQTPVAAFTATCEDRTCRFVDESRDPDGSLVTWSWDFGDGNSAQATSQGERTHSFAENGTYAVVLTVTDDGGALDTATREVTVIAAAPGVALTAVGTKEKGRHVVQLAWTGLAAEQVGVYRNGTRIATVPNAGTYRDAPDGRGQATYEYRVCDATGAVCSAPVTVVF